MLNAVTVTDNDSAQWSQFLTDFPGAYKSFLDNRAALQQLAPTVAKRPELQAQYMDLMQRSDELAPKLAKLKGVYDTVSGFFRSAGKVYDSAVDATSRAIESVANTVSAARKWLGLGCPPGERPAGELAELGIAPIVVGIAAGAALATLSALVYWVADAYKFSKRVNLAVELENRGYNSTQISQLLNSALGPPQEGGFLKDARSLMITGGLILVGVLLLPRLLESFNSRR